MPMSIDRRRLLGGSAAIGLAGAFPRRLYAQEPRTKIRVGLVRLISSGPIFIAEAKNFFDKVNLDVELKYFADGALAMPALVAGELDLTASTLNAACSLGLQAERGSLEPGKRADLLVLRSQRLLDLVRVGVPAIRAVVKDGRVVARDGRRVA